MAFRKELLPATLRPAAVPIADPNVAPVNLAPGETGSVCGFEVIDEATERLMQMGIIEGASIEMVRLAPTGDPVEIRVMGYALSLRKAEAQHVLIDSVAAP